MVTYEQSRLAQAFCDFCPGKLRCGGKGRIYYLVGIRGVA